MNPDLTIRLARPAEQMALEDLQRRASWMNQGDRAFLLANPNAIELPLEQITGGQVFLAEQSGQVLGFAAVLPRPDGDAELDGLFTEPRAVRQGVATALVGHAKQMARAWGASALHVVGNPHAERFYASCGFELQGSAQTQGGPGQALCLALE